MKELLKYLFPVLLAAITFISGADESVATDSRSAADDAIAPTASYASDSWAPDASLNLPEEFSGTHAFRLPSASQRTKTAQKHASGFLRASKLTATGIRHFIDKTSLTVHSSFIKPDHLLISLGKLLI